MLGLGFCEEKVGSKESERVEEVMVIAGPALSLGLNLSKSSRLKPLRRRRSLEAFVSF